MIKSIYSKSMKICSLKCYRKNENIKEAYYENDIL